MVLHLHGMEEAGVRFPVGPHFHEISRKRGRVVYGASLVWLRQISRSEKNFSDQCGGVREWLKRTVLKTVMSARASKVRILPPPH